MNTPPLSPDEPVRLESLRSLNLVDTPLEERFERITRMARRSMNVEIAAVSLLESDRQWFKSIQGLDVEGTNRDVSFCGHTILQPGVMVVCDAQQDARFSDNPLVTGPPHIRFYAGCPVRTMDGSAVGTLCVIDSHAREPSQEDLETLRDLAGMVESEIRCSASNAVQAMLLEEVGAEHRRSRVDPLTRVWGREGILGVAQEASARTSAGECGMALVMVDIDRFKDVNDRHGHAAGDEVLRVLARRMLGALREGDVVGRLSGDEFLLVLSPCDTPEAAASAVERVRSRVAEKPVRHGGATLSVSASFGVSFLERGGKDSVSSMMERADRAMYDSKRGGRGRVSVSREAA